MDGMTEGGGGIMVGWRGEAGKVGNGAPAGGHANLDRRAKGVTIGGARVCLFPDISNLSQTPRRRHTQTLQPTLNCHMRLFPTLGLLLTAAAAGRFGLHQNLIKFYCAVKRVSAVPWIILPYPNTVVQFRFVIKKSLNVIKPAWQQGMK